MNALSDAICRELLATGEQVERDPQIRAVVLTGAGRAFCAGANLKQAVADSLEQPQASVLRVERLVPDAYRHSHDIREGLAASVGKRKPEFKSC